MTPQPDPLSAIAEPMRSSVREYSSLLRDLAGEDARALTLFGAIAAGTFDASRHTARSAFVVARVNLRTLRLLAEHGGKLGKAHIAAPLIMTPRYIEESRDTFPLELIEIKQNHLTIFGEDHFESLVFEEADVRLQCERELKVLLIGLRQGLLAAAGRDRFLADLEMSMGESLLRVLRGMLWIKGRRETRPAAMVVEEMENLASTRLAGVRAALDPTATHGWEQLESLYHDIQALGETVNAW